MPPYEAKRAKKRVVNVRVLPGEPTDGSGRVCIHLFVRDAAGPFVEPHVLDTVEGRIVAGPARGRLACDRRRRPDDRPDRDGVMTVTHRTDDPRAVTCPRCMAAPEYAAIMAILKRADEKGE